MQRGSVFVKESIRKTSYILNYAEDFECNMTKEEWENFAKEAIFEKQIKFVNLTKIRKYTREVFRGYEDGKYGYYYKAEDSPPTRISGTGIFEKEWYIQILTEFVENKDKYINTIPLTHKTQYKKRALGAFCIDTGHFFHTSMAQCLNLLSTL